MEIEAEELIAMLRHAKLEGAWESLNWIGKEWNASMRLKDLEECLQEAIIRLEEELAEEYKRNYCISISVSHIIERRLSKKVMPK